MLHRVLRAIPGPEGNINPGSTVDVSGWSPMNVRAMVNQHYIEPIQMVPEYQPATVATVTDGPSGPSQGVEPVPSGRVVAGKKVARRANRGQE